MTLKLSLQYTFRAAYPVTSSSVFLSFRTIRACASSTLNISMSDIFGIATMAASFDWSKTRAYCALFEHHSFMIYKYARQDHLAMTDFGPIRTRSGICTRTFIAWHTWEYCLCMQRPGWECDLCRDPWQIHRLDSWRRIPKVSQTLITALHHKSL